MRVYVYKTEGPTMVVLVEASPGSGRAPVLLEGVTRENLVGKVLPVVESMRGPRESDR